MLHKEVPREWLREEVGRWIRGVDRKYVNKTRLDPLPEGMILLIDEPGSRTHLGGLRQFG